MTKEEKFEAMKKIIVEENIHQFWYGGNVGTPMRDANQTRKKKENIEKDKENKKWKLKLKKQM